MEERSRSRDAAEIRALTFARAGSLERVQRQRLAAWAVVGLVLIAATVWLPAGAPFVVVVAVAAVALLERRLHDRTDELVAQRVLGAALEGRISDLTRLTRAGSRVLEVLTVDDVLEAILGAALDLTAARRGSVMVVDGDRLRVAVAAGDDPAPIDATIAVGDGLAGRVARTGEPLAVDGQVATWQVGGETPTQRSAGSSVIVPLAASGRVDAVLSLQRTPDGAPFSDAEIRALALFAEQAAVAFGNARRVEQRSEFVATVIHDLKGPLTAIIGFATTLRRTWDGLDEQQRERSFHAIDSQARRMYQLINEVLRTATLDAGAPLRQAPVDVHALIHDLTDVLPREIVIRRSGRPIATGDADALTHVFSNLIDNAVKYSGPDTPIELLVAADGDTVVVEVTDHGEGIPEAQAPHIFERFRRAGDSSPGVGLGLHIVRTIVEAHGGAVSARSKLGEGSTFRVVLPSWQPDDDPSLVEAERQRR